MSSSDIHFLDFLGFMQGDYTNKFDVFYELMKFRVKEILVVASLYDDFVMEADATYAEQLTEEYSSLNISTPPPRITRVSGTKKALEQLTKREYNLVIITSRISGTDPFSLAAKIKESYPDISTVLLLTSFSDVAALPPVEQRGSFDKIFIYTGNSDIFLTIVKQIEDMKNIEHDTKLGKVRVIVVVEDTIAYYSLFLPIIYKMLVRQTRRLMGESVNNSHRLLLVRGRPKVVLATNYEEAIELIEKYKKYLFAVITDVGFPKGGVKQMDTGIELVKYIQSHTKNVPVLLQSSDVSNSVLADKLGVNFVHKLSPQLLKEVKQFFDLVGFGDFIFRNSKGEVEARAQDINEFKKVVKKISDDSILYHAVRDHFSNWLFTRTEFDLAEKLKQVTADEFKHPAEIRKFLIDFFDQTKTEKKRGVIVDFDRKNFEGKETFIRLGHGSLGGKGRGLAFAYMLLNRAKDYFASAYPNIDVGIPQTIVLTTDLFDDFMEENDLYEVVLNNDLDDDELMQLFLSKKLPKEVQRDIQKIMRRIKVPIAVRSSSLLEDSQFQPFAGIYTTYMLPNSNSNYKERVKDLVNAIKLVYASTYTRIAKSYIQTIGQKIEIEKMAVVIQTVVGRRHDELYYPSISGVAQSFNYYPMDILKAEDGVVHLALGLGASITEGMKYLSFSPRYPAKLVQHYSPMASLENSQREFFALSLSQDIDLSKGELATLTKCDLSVAEQHGELQWSAATVDLPNLRIIDGIRRDGPRVITFPYILKYKKIPLSKLVMDVTKVAKEGFGCDVELEFAMVLDYKEKRHEMRLLQIRPLVTDTVPLDVNMDQLVSDHRPFLFSDQVLGNGISKSIVDVVYVDPDTFTSLNTLEIQQEIAYFNKKLKDEGREYLLIGPGRWGTADRFLGIPVSWNEIDSALAIVEYGLQNFQIDPSHGSHFFLNITSARKGYFTVQYNDRSASIDWDWLKNQCEVIEVKKYVKHVRTPDKISVIINGKVGSGAVVKAEILDAYKR